MKNPKKCSPHTVAELLKNYQTHVEDVPIVSQIVSPTNDHLSNCLESLWLACRPGTCGGNTWESGTAKRRSMSAIVESWCAMESAVNLALFHKLKNKDCGYFVPTENRQLIDKDIARNLNSSLSFEKRFDYIQESHPCNCTTLKLIKGKVLQFEKLRNSLVHGYAKKKDSMLSILPIPVDVEINPADGNVTVRQSYRVEESEFRNPEGDIENWLAQFKELGLRHDPTELCRHDAGYCIVLVITVLRWLDTHYGISFFATWEAHDKKYIFSSRDHNQLQGKGKRLIGFDNLWREFQAKDFLEKSVVKNANKKSKPPAYRQNMRRNGSKRVH